MLALKKVVNRAAVREAFRRQGTRVPPGFMDEVEQALYVLLRRAANEDLEPAAAPDAGGEVFLKQSLLKEAMKDSLGQRRVDAALVARVNAAVVSKVSEASVRSGARAGGVPPAVPVPSRVLRAFIRSEESRSLTFTQFFRRWQDPGFRRAWTERAETEVARGS